MERILRLPYIESYLKIRAPNPEASNPRFYSRPIQLAGHDLTNNHTFMLLSGLLWQALYKKNIPSGIPAVNAKIRDRKISESML